MTAKIFDFEALRARRNESVRRRMDELYDELGAPPEDRTYNYAWDSCYCTCGMSDEDPICCEHDWNGPEWTSDDGCASSVTCARCGTTAMSHDMRVLP